jgi:ribonuclease PH
MNTTFTYKRKDGRTPNQLRQVSLSYGIYESAAGSILFEMGKTKIICAVSLQNGVPQFLRGKGAGWLTAEYALLPMSTTTRTQRESSTGKKDGRSIEIARFIGRCFRTIADLSILGERTITIDCDVLQADGGTRTASITAAYLALAKAQDKWLKARIIDKPFITETIAALSVGIVNDRALLDLNYEEDSIASADFNFVLTESGKVIEMQGGAESAPISWEQFEEIRRMACDGVANLFTLCGMSVREKKIPVQQSTSSSGEREERIPLFSLKNRQNTSL